MLHSRSAAAHAAETRAVVRPLGWQMAAVAFGFAAGGTEILGGAAPLGLALTLGCSAGYAMACGVGAILGGLLFLEPVHAFCLAGAIGAAAVVRTAAGRSFWPGAVSGAATMLLVPLLLALQHALEPADAFWTLATAGLAVGIGWVLFRHPAGEGRNRLCWLAMVIACGGCLHYKIFYTGIAALCVVLMAVALRGSTERTALYGVVLDACFYGGCPSLGFGAAAIAVGAVAAARLTPGDRVAGAAVCLGCGALGAVLAPELSAVYAFGVSVAAGLLLFLLLPPKVLDVLAPADVPAAQPGLHRASAQLERVADTLQDIAETVNGVYKRLPPADESFEKVADYACEQVCSTCRNREECWVTHYGDSMAGVSRLRPVLEEQGRIEPGQLPRQFCACIHPLDFCGALTRGQAMRLTRREERMRCGALRGALTEQYGAIAEALAAMAEQLNRARMEEPARSARLARLFSGIGLEPLETAVEREGDGRLHARVTLPRTGFDEEELTALAGEVSQLCRRGMTAPQVETRGGTSTLYFQEKPVYLPVFGLAERPAGRVSGDAAEQFCDIHDHARMILCDGMGTGKMAAVDGVLSTSLTGKLLRAGFTGQAAARLVNVVLSLKSQGDSSATLDLISVDLFSGRAELFKAGAAAGYLVQHGQPRRMEGPGLPMGVVDTVMGKTTRVQMREGDLAVLLSDGAYADGSAWLEQQLELCAKVGSTPQEIADILADTAARRCSPNHPDDITVAVMRLERVV